MCLRQTCASSVCARCPPPPPFPRFLRIPDWADYELYNRRDIEAALGERAWVISQKDASIRNFGFLVGHRSHTWPTEQARARKRRRRPPPQPFLVPPPRAEPAATHHAPNAAPSASAAAVRSAAVRFAGAAPHLFSR